MTELGGKGKYFLAGETVESWRALSLRGLWTVDDTALFLKTGQNRFATASGSMAEVIHHSTQHVRDDDLRAIATYLKALPPGENELPAPSKPRAALTPHTPDTLYTSRGGLAYAQFCGDCHRARVSADGQLYTCLFSGQGQDLRPALAQSEAALAAQVRALWQSRADRYSEIRFEAGASRKRVEMYLVGG